MTANSVVRVVMIVLVIQFGEELVDSAGLPWGEDRRDASGIVGGLEAAFEDSVEEAGNLEPGIRQGAAAYMLAVPEHMLSISRHGREIAP